MDYKKKYEDALEKARVWKEKSGMPIDRQGILDDIFPELKESEDEKIRKALLNEFIHLQSKGYKFAGLEGKEIITWLEKQGEKKPTWSEEDEKILKSVISSIRISRSSCEEDDDVRDLFDNEIDWLESLKDRVQPQPKQEWSEEDIATISRVISIVKWAAYSDHSHPILNDEGATELVERLESLKERYNWKLSDKQIKALRKAVDEHFDIDDDF